MLIITKCHSRNDSLSSLLSFTINISSLSYFVWTQIHHSCGTLIKRGLCFDNIQASFKKTCIDFKLFFVFMLSWNSFCLLLKITKEIFEKTISKKPKCGTILCRRMWHRVCIMIYGCNPSQCPANFCKGSKIEEIFRSSITKNNEKIF